MRILVAFTALAVLSAQEPSDFAGWIARGIAAYKSAQYRDAVNAFQRAVDLNPSSVDGHNYLGTAWMSQYVPGVFTGENEAIAQNASRAFQRVLDLESSNPVALQSLASLAYTQSSGQRDPQQKLQKLIEARSWYLRLAAADPDNKQAHYSLGVTAWALFYPDLMAARSQLGMKPEDPGPLRDASVRHSLRSRHGALVEDGIASLNRALVLDPDYDDAMAYLNLLIRERGDLRDSVAEAQRDVEVADEWVRKALETKKRKAAGSGQGSIGPPPPPSPKASSNGYSQQLRIAGNVQAAKLIEKPEPVYPELAARARIQGVVRFQVIIGKDGRISKLQLISGHPLLVPAAETAVRGHVYQPTLLGAGPVEVVTEVDVNFSLR